ncbi:chaperonin 10-like protein [Xylariaceae sp. FL1651]|nr:chaperonin 10-like protein [Xylariaceae sp. FL1651]
MVSSASSTYVSPHKYMIGASQSSFSSTAATSIRSIKSLVPLLDRVLVQRIKAETKTAGGIFLPESSVKELNEAKVLAVGPGALSKDGARVPMGVAQGDRVLIPQFGGSPVKVGEEEFHLFRDSEILAKINE